jgi:hypothetical protein
VSSQKRRPRRGKAGDLEALKRHLWAAVLEASALLDCENPDVKLRAVHAVSQSSSAYRSLVESTDLERRISALEGAQEDNDD